MESQENKAIYISQDAYGTFVLIKNGILGKFTRLMDKSEAKSVRESGYLGGEPMPYSFTFAPNGEVNQNAVASALPGDTLDLIKDGEKVGHIVVSSVFKVEYPEHSIFRAKDIDVEQGEELGELGVGGEFELYGDTLKEIKERISNLIKKNNFKKITAIMLTADPFHRLHERLIRLTIDKADLVVIFLVRTFGEDGRLSFDLRRKTVEYFVDRFIPKDRVIIIPFENTYLFSDHINPVLECIAAKNLGATKLVVGQNHAGIGMFYNENQANTVLDKYSSELNLDLIVMPEFVYCNECRTIVSVKTCPHGAHHHIKYHAHTLKELLFAGIMPPAILMRKEISAMILSELFPQRFKDLQRLYDDIFPNSGIIEKHDYEDFYSQLMNLYQTTSLT